MKVNAPANSEGKRKARKSILHTWKKVTSSTHNSKLTEQEEAQFERARFAEEQKKRSSFLLGGSISQLAKNV